MGADHVIDHRSDLAVELAAIGFRGVDYILCTADTDAYYATLVDLVAPGGSICFIVTATAPVDMARLQPKSLTLAWELMFTRSMFSTADMAEQGRLLDEVATLIDGGEIRCTLTERLGPICAKTLREGHARIESNATLGKIAVEGW